MKLDLLYFKMALRTAVIIFLMIINFSCGMRYKLLLDNKTKIPYKKSFFIDRPKVQANVFDFLDTTCIYYELNKNENRDIFFYKFYSNGCFNYFYEPSPDSIKNKSIDPNFTGARGVFYTINGEIYYKIFLPVSQMGRMGIINGKLEVERDSIIIYGKNFYQGKAKLVKKFIDKLDVNYKANW